ncbi:hypothetical protein HID58_094967 [Brassica napus]|uniref:K+ potassium transporter integral membrane domain-containing protein n=1 Tax=Brassica napus TaxID=3708 RepID=A0ABQ7X5B4_BRANA|nr:hypothetical protein HID58_094967 [Brassica napus]
MFVCRWTLAIYSLLCRHGNVNLIPNQQRSDEDLTTYSRTSVAEGSFAAKTKKWLESRHSKKRALLVIVLIGTCMMIGDGILTPAISVYKTFFLTVLSATGGIRVNNPKDEQRHRCACVCHPFNWTVQYATLWYGQGGVALCAYRSYLVPLHWSHWHIQHLQTRYKRFKSVFAKIYILVLQKKRARWLDFAWWHSSQHNR